ncbi:hypothetical protein LJC63_09545 [Ruminococcaceae bacterium OttesenSCG-928-L11]|nr:hypothetical protein [Ruminococcaceae bacterium OttesenSCG-928-L11]
MAKKSFKDTSKASIAAVFMSEAEPVQPQETPYGEDMRRQELPDDSPKLSRMNLKIPTEYKDYLEFISWKNRTNMTQYLLGLIRADMEKYDKEKFK